MSAVIKTTTPFVIESVLRDALQAIYAEPQLVTHELLAKFSQRNPLVVGDMLTNRSDYNGRQFFRLRRDRWVFVHDSDEHQGRIATANADRRYTPVHQFLTTVSTAYDRCYQTHLEELAEQERILLEEQRKERVEATRQQAIRKAKEQGYSIKEKRRDNGQIQLVLTRTV